MSGRRPPEDAAILNRSGIDRRNKMRWTLATLGVATAFALAAPAAIAQDSTTRIRVTLEGELEAPVVGDLDGTGFAVFRINPDRRQVCYSLSVQDIAPATAAHIHIAPPGSAGPVVVPLAAPTSGQSQGCVTVSYQLALALVQQPQNYYVNVHNADFPGGALRAQLG
jgi:hypothetical protein